MPKNAIPQEKRGRVDRRVGERPYIDGQRLMDRRSIMQPAKIQGRSQHEMLTEIRWQLPHIQIITPPKISQNLFVAATTAVSLQVPGNVLFGRFWTPTIGGSAIVMSFTTLPLLSTAVNPMPPDSGVILRLEPTDYYWLQGVKNINFIAGAADSYVSCEFWDQIV